jgi:hypothetical protein
MKNRNYIIHWILENEVPDTYLSMEDKEMVLSLTEGKDWQVLVEEVLGYDPFRCKKCKKGKMLMHEKIDANPRAVCYKTVFKTLLSYG